MTTGRLFLLKLGILSQAPLLCVCFGPVMPTWAAIGFLIAPLVLIFLGETLHEDSMILRLRRAGLRLQIAGAILSILLTIVGLIGGWLWVGLRDWIVFGTLSLLSLPAAYVLTRQSRRRLAALPSRRQYLN